MTADQYTQALEYLGLTAAQFVSILGYDIRQSYRWERGATIPRSIAILLQEAVLGNVDLNKYLIPR